MVEAENMEAEAQAGDGALRLTLIAGLPASGKTFLLRDLAAEGAATVDDPKRLDELPNPPLDWLAVADSAFCHANARLRAESALLSIYGDAKIEWVFFENDAVGCMANADIRGDLDLVACDIRVLPRLYSPPESARPVFSPPAPRP